jgi:hypothetical protein
MAGASIEALLHWRLDQLGAALCSAAERAPTSKGRKKDLNDYVLHEYIEVAEDLDVLTAREARMAMLAKGFRNLIHPGRAARTQERCTRSTALTAVGAMEAIIELFARHHGGGP